MANDRGRRLPKPPPPPLSTDSPSAKKATTKRPDAATAATPEPPELPKRQRAALAIIAAGGLVEDAGKAAGVCRVTLWRWRQSDPAFAAAWAEATDAGTLAQEDILAKCVLKAADDPRYIGALLFSLCNRAPHRWRHRREIEHTGTISHRADLRGLDDDELERLAEKGLARRRIESRVVEEGEQ